MRQLAKICKDEAGVTNIEYALVGSLIALLILAAVEVLGVSLSGFFSTSAATVNAITNSITP
jgi:pilus assembly protein Flp/PilA